MKKNIIIALLTLVSLTLFMVSFIKANEASKLFSEVKLLEETLETCQALSDEMREKAEAARKTNAVES